MKFSGKLLKGPHSTGTHHLISSFFFLPTWNTAGKKAGRGHAGAIVKPRAKGSSANMGVLIIPQNHGASPGQLQWPLNKEEFVGRANTTIFIKTKHYFFLVSVGE